MGRGTRRLLIIAALTLLAIVGSATAAHAGVTTSAPSYEVIKEQNVVVPMSDGTKLVADIYRPKPKRAGQRFPCLYEVTPYRKELRAAEAANFFPARGFVYIEVDARGTGGSQGEYDGVFLPQEQKDGYDGIEWLATKYQPCNGKVGMWGGSYSGINQYLIATSPKGTPPHLRTIAPQRAGSDLYRDIVYTGGILTGSFGLLWSGANSGFNAIGADPTTGPDPQLAANALVDHLRNDPLFTTYLNQPFDAPVYRNSSVIYRLRKLNLPVLHLDGFYDAFTRGQLQAIGRLLELERRGVVKGPHYAVIGPWNHTDSRFLTHPPYDRRIVDWYRHWLDGAPKPAWFSEPRVSYCVMLEARNGRCDWRKTNSWPPPTNYAPFYLNAGGRLGADKPGGSSSVGEWTYDPSAGQGENAFSKWDNAASAPQRDADQATEDEFKGISFSTPVLSRSLDIAGPITLSLKASTQPLAPANAINLAEGARVLGQPGAAQTMPPYNDTDFVVKISDVDPAGKSTLIQTGFLRASHRLLDGSRTRKAAGRTIEPVPFHVESKLAPPEPGRTYTYEIEVWPTAKRFAAGHKLRVTLYSADTANHLTLVKPVTNTVHAGSYLLLPRPGAAATGGRRCLPRRLAVSGRRIGPAKLRGSFKRFAARYRKVGKKRGRVTRFCVRGGGKFWVGSKRNRIDFIATTARRHKTRRVGPGSRLRSAKLSGAKRIAKSLLLGHRMGGGRVVYGVKGGRVRFLAVVPRREARKRALRKRLRALRLIH